MRITDGDVNTIVHKKGVLHVKTQGAEVEIHIRPEGTKVQVTPTVREDEKWEIIKGTGDKILVKRQEGDEMLYCPRCGAYLGDRRGDRVFKFGEEVEVAENMLGHRWVTCYNCGKDVVL